MIGIGIGITEPGRTMAGEARRVETILRTDLGSARSDSESTLAVPACTRGLDA